jgi:high-affinity nickel-transport protein
VRKVFYNLTITALSVAVALIIGTIEIVGLFSGTSVDIGTIGFIIVAMFVLTWAIALAVWHFGRIEERWSAHLAKAPAPTP